MADPSSSSHTGLPPPTSSSSQTAQEPSGSVHTARASGSMAAGLRPRRYGVSSGRSSTQSCSQQQFGGERWRTLRIRLLCDNQAIVHCVGSGSSRCPHVMSLLRSLFLSAAKYSFTVSAQHIPGTHNVIADSLSRFRMQVFRSHAPQASPKPTPLPHSLPFMGK